MIFFQQDLVQAGGSRDPVSRTFVTILTKEKTWHGPLLLAHGRKANIWSREVDRLMNPKTADSAPAEPLMDSCVRIPVKATSESSRRRPPSPVEGDQFWDEPLDARLKFIGKVTYRVCSIKSAA